MGGHRSARTTERALRRLARERFGWSRLRAGQLEAATALVGGRDALVVMPTGGGKSAVYQLAALAIDGPTVVVSPLISLQQDQVAALTRTGTHDAVALNSAQKRTETEQAWRALEDGGAEFVFLAPEQLGNAGVLERLRELRPSLLVVDEAHCVSSWGHDFRPEYLRIGEAAEALGRPVVAALTATAAPPVREEVVSRLGLSDPLVVVQGFDRPNLRLEVRRCPDEATKRREVLLRVATSAKPGLLYVATRKDAEAYAEELADLGLAAAAYHAGLRAAEREQVHEAFLAGDLDVVAATSAFGMGIDKPDVRFVVHASVTDSLDSYWQEVGRAGRDGEPALTAMFYRAEDLALQRFLGTSTPDADLLEHVAGTVRARGPLPRAEVAAQVGASASKVAAAVHLLLDADGLVSTDGGLVWGGGASVPEAVAAAVEVAQARQRMDRSRLEMLRGYAETTTCRRQFLLGYFGEPAPTACGRCDTCSSRPVDAADPAASLTDAEAEAAAARAAEDAADDTGEGTAWPVNTRVVHRAWGPGVVMRPEGDRITVLFEQQGYKTLGLAAIEEHRLLERAG